jgi:TetR/AcrR family fatty acid metabolism transcriptional regulator
MKGKDPKEAKRELIFKAAVEVFSTRGYHNATMSEIATAAGIGKGTIYEYFPSKLQLFQQMLIKGMDTYYASIDPEELKHKSIQEKLRIVMEGHILFCRQHSQLTRLVFWEAEGHDDEVKEWMLQMRKEKEARLQDLLNDGIANGELRGQDSYIMALTVSGVIGAVWVPLVLDEWDVDAAYLAERITDIIMNGIKNRA